MSARSRLASLIPLFVLGTGACPVSGAGALAGAPTAPADAAIVVQNYYYALPGKAEEVYRWRLHASEVRVRLGLPAGRVLKRAPVSEESAENVDVPDVVWECEYPSAKARAADVARLDASPEFDAVQGYMQTLIRQFRRAVFTLPR